MSLQCVGACTLPLLGTTTLAAKSDSNQRWLCQIIMHCFICLLFNLLVHVYIDATVGLHGAIDQKPEIPRLPPWLRCPLAPLCRQAVRVPYILNFSSLTYPYAAPSLSQSLISINVVAASLLLSLCGGVGAAGRGGPCEGQRREEQQQWSDKQRRSNGRARSRG